MLPVALVRLDRVRVTMQNVRALDGIHLTLHRGEHIVLTGPNGSGKSTLLRVLRGEAYPDQKQGGSVTWFPPSDQAGAARSAEPLADSSPLAGRAMASLLSPALQEHYTRQAWHMRGEELVLAGLYDDYLLYREPGEDERAMAADLADSFRAGHLLGMELCALSQGQLRLVLLLRALIRRPALLLLDEALDGLDAPMRTAFVLALEELARQPHAPTMVLATHRLALPSFIRRILRMEHGSITQESELAPCGANAPPTAPDAGEARLALSGTTSSGAMHIILHNATVFVDRAEVLHRISWEIRPGEQWLVTGGNGAGKSTLLRLLAGEETVAAGGSLQRAVDGNVLQTLEDVQTRIRLVSDRLQALYTYNESAAGVVFSGLCGSVGVYREPAPQEHAEVLARLAEVGMLDCGARPFRSLSTGQARKILLARALAGHPTLLLLDEPFSGLDRQSRHALIAILEARIHSGMQTILVSHHTSDRLPSATHEALLENGFLIAAARLASA